MGVEAEFDCLVVVDDEFEYKNGAFVLHYVVVSI